MIKNLFLLTIAAFIYAAWQLKGIIFVLTLLLLGGCNAMETTCYYDAYGDHSCTKTYYFESVPQPSTVYVVEEKEPEDTLIYIENITDYSDSNSMSIYVYDPMCNSAPVESAPHIAPPYYCYHYPNGNVECDWYTEYGCYDVYRWDDWSCTWYYQFSWCE